ncbi:hypothetical protein NDU88_010282 [Pleurodeles waltl]|uniref:Uncharacterized protein n=1 Tax=Pleurodeles waltl TaxID=8319 RepID=A0AAV7PUF8_PLEWA|nr:hypothetical protein NDU88_010282 [Pleurodeles waltl]
MVAAPPNTRNTTTRQRGTRRPAHPRTPAHLKRNPATCPADFKPRRPLQRRGREAAGELLPPGTRPFPRSNARSVRREQSTLPATRSATLRRVAAICTYLSLYQPPCEITRCPSASAAADRRRPHLQQRQVKDGRCAATARAPALGLYLEKKKRRRERAA